MHGCSLMFLLGAMTVISLPCFGRSANIPLAWNIAPSLEIEQKVTVEHSSSKGTQEISMDKVLQTSDTRRTTKATELTSSGDTPHIRRSDFVLENIENEAHLAKIVKDAGPNPMEESMITDSVPSRPRNVVLLLIAESSQDRENIWKDFRASHSFPVEGFLQSCHNTDIDATRFSLDDVLVSGNKDKECDCEHFLRSNVDALLFWARDVKGMATGTLSNANFTIPSFFGYEESVDIAKELDETDENNTKPEIRNIKPDTRDDWHMIDLGKPTNRVSSLPTALNKREDGADDPAWNVFDVFSRIRMAMFRSLLESLGGNVGTPDESINPSRKLRSLPANLGDVITELKSLSNEKGFILVATAPGSELNSVLELLQHELSQDTLLVVAGICTHDAKPIPFFAQGPAAKMLHEAATIWDLPIIIKNTIASGCQDLGCRIRRHDDLPPPIAHLKIVHHNGPIFRRLPRNVTKKLTDEKEDELKNLEKKNELRTDGQNREVKDTNKKESEIDEQKRKLTTDENKGESKKNENKKESEIDEQKRKLTTDENKGESTKNENKKESEIDEQKRKLTSDENKGESKKNENKKESEIDEEKRKLTSDENKGESKKNENKKESEIDEQRRKFTTDENKGESKNDENKEESKIDEQKRKLMMTDENKEEKKEESKIDEQKKKIKVDENKRESKKDAKKEESKFDEKKGDSKIDENETKTKKDGKASEVMTERSSSGTQKMNKFTTVFGTIASIIVAFSLT